MMEKACGLAVCLKKEKPLKTLGFQGFGGDYGTRFHYGAAAVQPAAGNAPPERCIQIGSSPCLHQKEKHPGWGAFLFGGDYGTRTCDLMRVKHAL